MKKYIVVLALLVCLLPSCFTVAHAAQGYPLCAQNLYPENLLAFLNENSNLALVRHDCRSDDIEYVSWTSIEYLSDLVLNNQWGGAVAYNPDMDVFYVDVPYQSTPGVSLDEHAALGTWDGYVFVASADSEDVRLLEYIRRAAAATAISVDHVVDQIDYLTEYFGLNLELVNTNLDSIDTRLQLAQIYFEAINTNIGNLQMYLYDGWTNSDGTVEIESIAQKLDKLIEATEGMTVEGNAAVEELLTKIGNRLLVTDNGTTYTIAELVRNLWNAQLTANNKLGTITGHVDGLESALSTIGNRLLVTDSGVTYTISELVRNLWTAQLNTNDKLGTLTGYVDQVEGRLLRTVDGVQYTMTDTTYHAWQQLKTLTGYVDGLEASSLTANNLLRDLVGHVDGVEGTLSSVLHWLQVDAYGDQDVYAIMSGMVYNFVYGTPDQQTVIQSVWDKYWLTEEQMLAATFRVQLSADDLRDMQRRFNEAGIPTEVRYLEDAGIYVLRSAGNARAVDFDDFSQNQSQAAGLNTYPRFFSNAGCLYYAAEAGSATSLHNLNGKMGTVIQRLDTLIANQGQNLEADITVDLGDITISTDDTTLTAYIKMLAYGQQDMYSALAAISAEYRDASASDKAAMDKILMNYWYTPGSNIGQVYFPGDQLRNIHQHMVEIGYPCLVVWDSSLEAYVIKLTGNPRVSDVFDFSYTGAYSGKQDLYQDGVVYYLTQGGYLLSSRNDGTEASIDSMAAKMETLVTGHQSATIDALSDIENALSNLGGSINIENNTNIDISEENDAYNIFFVEDLDGGDDQSIVDLSGDALTVFGKLLNFLYQVGFKDALDGAGPGIGDLSDFYLDDSGGSVDLWGS